jgi:hypothetical protein
MKRILSTLLVGLFSTIILTQAQAQTEHQKIGKSRS